MEVISGALYLLHTYPSLSLISPVCSALPLQHHVHLMGEGRAKNDGEKIARQLEDSLDLMAARRANQPLFLWRMFVDVRGVVRGLVRSDD